MRILVVSMSAELGGIEKSMIAFLKFLVSKPDFKVDLMLWKNHGELLSEIPKQVTQIDSPAPGNLKNILQKCRIDKLLRYVSLKLQTKLGTPWFSFPNLKQEYDIAIAYSQDGYSPYYILDNVKAPRKFMWYHHGAYLHKGKQRHLDLRYYPRFTNVIAVSESIRDILVKEVPSCAANIKVINNLIDEEYILQASKEECKTFDCGNGICKVLTIGRLSAEKGQLRVLDIAYELKQNEFDIEWIFVGDGPQREECIEKTKALGLEGTCKFIGAIANPYPYFRDADICVIPSYVEADPVTIQEALILHKKIVAANIPSIRAILSGIKAGHLVDFGSPSAIADAIETSYKAEGITDYIFTRNDRVRSLLSKLL